MPTAKPADQPPLPAPLAIRMLGSFSVEVRGEPLPPMRSRKEHWLLALLALQNGAPVARDWLAQTLWPFPEYAQDMARGYLRRALWQLGKAMGAEGARIQRPTSQTIALNLEGVEVDVATFDEALSRNERDSLREAIRLYRGPLLTECTEEWVRLERESRAVSFRSALESLAEMEVANGDREAATDCYRRAVVADPFWEPAQRGLLQALAEQGAYNAASQAYYDFHRLLARERSQTPDAETVALFQRIREQSRKVDRSAVSDPRNEGQPALQGPGSLPHYLSELVGREAEVAEITNRLQHRRLVTLTGPGGVGKTRLAVHAAATLQSGFQDGVCFVDLSGVLQPEMVAQAVATSLDALASTPYHGSRQAALRRLRDSKLLLVLDNCERVAAACAEIAREILAECPSVRILATSRRALGIAGETAWCVPSLPFPDPERLSALDCEPGASAHQYPALQLFLQVASDVQRLFGACPQDVLAAARICSRLDGIPLAIELAAAQLRVLSLDDLLQDIEGRFRLLDMGRIGMVGRHRTLRTTIQWGWDLLGEEERSLLMQLSIFRGGFLLAAAESVGRPERTPDRSAEAETLFWLERLVDASLVTVEFHQGQTRYRLLEPIREFARDQRSRANSEEQERDLGARHARWFADRAEQGEKELTGSRQHVWLVELEREHDNIRAALDWALGNGESATALRLAGAMWRFWHMRSYLQEGADWLDRVLEADDGTDVELRVKALSGAGNIAYSRGDYITARTCYTGALEFRRSTGDVRGIAASLGSLANVAREERQHQEARELLQESLRLFRSIEDRRGTALTLANLALVTFRLEDYAAAADLHDESIEVFRQLGDLHNVAQGLSNMANVLLQQEKLDRVHALLLESLAINESLQLRRGVARCLTMFAWLAAKQGAMRRAALLIGAQSEQRRRTDSPLPALSQEEHAHYVETVRSALGPELFESLVAAGQALPLDQAVAFARSELCDLTTA